MASRPSMPTLNDKSARPPSFCLLGPRSGTVDSTSWSVHDPCMAVKTITIDLEAYEALARRKKAGQSFSKVIKEHFGRPKTGRDLRRVLRDVVVSEDALSAIERQIEERRRDQARPARL